ncbi:hypothetical protein [Streptomyces sp. NPDC088350]
MDVLPGRDGTAGAPVPCRHHLDEEPTPALVAAVREACDAGARIVPLCR